MTKYDETTICTIARRLALAGAVLAVAFGIADQAQAALLLKDSFGLSGLNGNGASRFDAAGNFVPVVLHTDLSGLRAEFPFTSSEVWTAPGGHGVPTWGFSVSSPDPYEKYGFPSFNGFGGSPEPTPADNGTMSLVVFPGDKPPPGKTDALLDFTPPAGAFQMSLDVVGGGPATAIGFTSSSAVLYDNFQSYGQVWMVLHGGLGQGQTGSWELHTNGLSGPGVSGTTSLGGFNPLAISYDPATHTVQGSVNGVLTPALSYTATGITSVGFEGDWTVNNFIVQTGAIPSSLVWSGSVNGVWDVNATANFSGNPSGQYSDGDHVTFDNTGSLTTIAITAGGVAPGSIVFSNSAGRDYSVSGGPIQGATSLELSGGGQVTLRSANTYTGATVVDSGTLILTSSTAIADGTSLTVGAGGSSFFNLSTATAPVSTSTPIQSVPEPGSLVLLATGGVALLLASWRNRVRVRRT